MSRGPATIATVIGRLLRRNPQWQHAFWLMRLQREWKQMPSPFAQGCVPWMYDGKKLLFAVRTHVWKQEIAMQRRELERTIRQFWPQLYFEKLWLRVVPHAQLPLPEHPPPDRVPLRRIAPPTPHSPGDRVLGALWEEAAHSDEPIATVMTRLLEKRMQPFSQDTPYQETTTTSNKNPEDPL